MREVTSNDPWVPSFTTMSEIADLTYNVAAFSEIMKMIWKRLNDRGKNWRHVYKALFLLEYLIKTGSNRVAHQCKEALASIKTLEDFQHLDNGTDQGINVREKAKALVALLKDDGRLDTERIRALKDKERIAQSTAGVASLLKESGRSKSKKSKSASDTVNNHQRGDHYEATHPLSASASLFPARICASTSADDTKECLAEKNKAVAGAVTGGGKASIMAPVLKPTSEEYWRPPVNERGMSFFTAKSRSVEIHTQRPPKLILTTEGCTNRPKRCLRIMRFNLFSQ